jgi:hypothetical protein
VRLRKLIRVGSEDPPFLDIHPMRRDSTSSFGRVSSTHPTLQAKCNSRCVWKTIFGVGKKIAESVQFIELLTY